MNFRLLFVILSALLLPVSVAKAQIFTTGAVTGDSSIESVGTTVYAYNFNYTPGVTTINGVSFTGIVPGTPSADFTLSNEGSLDGTGGGNQPDGTDGNYSSNLQALVSEGTGGNFTLVLQGLSIGQSYSFQAIFDANQKDARSQALADTTSGVGPYPTSSIITAGGDQGYPVQNPDPHPTGAQFITDSFTATGSTETLVAQYGGGAGAQMSAFVLQTVPEPGTWALMVVSAVGFAFLARRQALRA